MSEEKKNSFWYPNGLYRMKNLIGFISTAIGGAISFLLVIFLGMGTFYSFVSDNGSEGLVNLLEWLASWKIDVGLAILLGSTIISGSILLSGIRKE